MAKTITVYTTATCGYCKMLKAYLLDKKFPFVEKKVDEDHEAAQEMVQKSGQMGVPFTIVTDDEGNEKGILGFDQQRLKEVLLG